MKKLKIKKQCCKCPWKVSTNPCDIPNGYCKKKHKALKITISSGLDSLDNNHVMVCHETHNAHCVGYLYNQLGVGNNIGLRFKMRDYDLSEMEISGDQHEIFEDTIK